jgi:hypothetical protein
MRKITALGIAFFAVLALGAVAAASASATDEWLVGAKLVGLSEKISTVTEGKWLLKALSFFGSVVTHIVCSGKLIGTVNGLNPSGKGTDRITAIEGLNGEKGTINCEILHGELGACTNSLLALVTGLNLPWLTELALPTGAKTPTDKFTSTVSGKETGFKVECELSNKTIATEECEKNVESSELKSETNGTVTGSIPETEVTKCKGFGATGHINATNGVVKTLNGTALAVS